MNLWAREADDVPAFSLLVQDAIVRPQDIRYDRRQRRLALLINRYRWEEAEGRSRARALLRIESVTAVQRRLWPSTAAMPALALLAVTAEPAEHGHALLLAFAGGPTLRARAECVDLWLEDVSAPWSVRYRPNHELG